MMEKIKFARFDPYIFNGGTCVCLHGKDYGIIGGDTRLSNGYYSIQTRYSPKLCQLTNKCVISTVGCQSDCSTLHKTLKVRLKWFEHEHGKEMSIKAISQLVSNLLYSRRFFPYFSFCMLSGVNEKGEGISYGFDAIGDSGADGTGRELIQPLLDSQKSFLNQLKIPKNVKKDGLKLEDALSLIIDAFQSAGERDIYTGDYVDLFIITKDGIKKERIELKKD